MKIRILHCLETIGSGGVEQRRLSLARHLDKNLYEQRVVCSYVIKGFNTKLEKEGVQVTPITGLYHLLNFRYYYRLFRIIRQYKPHIIHGAVFEGVVSAAIGGFFLRVPVIIIEETSDPQNRSWRGNLLIKIFSIISDYVVGISPSVVNYLRETVHVKESKLRLINNGVEVPTDPERNEITLLKQSLGIAENDFVVGSVGRLRDFHKRFSDLIKAVALVKEGIPNLKLMIVGGGEDEVSLKQLANELGVSGNIIFTGFQERTSLYYACMNIFALASHMEGFGLVVVEAMFFKLPVVATAVGGVKDVVLDGQTGFLVEKHSPLAFATVFQQLYNNPDLRKELGENGYHRATKEYSAAVYVDKVAKLYNEACKNKGPQIQYRCSLIQ